MLSDGEHLIADSGYVLTDKMITPYRNNGHLVDSHRYFNYLLSQCRATVERCNGHLKMRMQRLGKLFCKSMNATNMHLAACAVIHNFILLGGEEMGGIVMENRTPTINVFEAINAGRDAGMQKQENIRRMLAERLAMYDV
ncbi:Protein ALP1-like [Frankliniella fusca]|uniref:Protein ALP1-like n=1 Tax=Frankliniella fusca TaxID=407009 RepID=A0AAE1I2V0_9NEOP|nr:Protein ALP1-like [Frankliniella fusca]